MQHDTRAFTRAQYEFRLRVHLKKVSMQSKEHTVQRAPAPDVADVPT